MGKKEKKEKKKKNKSKKGATTSGLIGFDEPIPTKDKNKFKDPWYKSAPLLDAPADGQEKKIRPVNGMYDTFQHYVRFKNKEGKWRGFYVICPDFIRLENRFKAGSKKKCPICLHFRGDDLPEHLNFFGSHKYYFDAFDLDAIDADSGARTFGIVQCGKYGRKDIIKAGRRNGATVDDFDDGCTLYWEKNRDAEDPKDKEGFSRGKRKSVKWVEKKKYFILSVKDEDGKARKIKGKPTDFDKVIFGPTPEEISADFERLGLWNELQAARGESSGKKKKKKDKDGKKSKRDK